LKLLKESPDHYYLTAENNNGKFIDGDWRDSDAWCFCYYKDEFYIAKSCSHFKLLSINFKNSEDIDEIIDDAYYKGRFWKNGKYLAFWENPSKSVLPKIISDIYKDTRIKITDDWWMELDNDRADPVKVRDYLGHKRKEIDMSKRHLTSPMYKDKKDISGFGSEKYQKTSSSNGFNSVAQMNYLKNENNLTLKAILNEINKNY